jgi:hypothetical protein
MSFKFKYSTATILLALYVPFEAMILKFLPVSDRIYSLLRFVPEIMIYLLLIINIIHSLYHHHWISRTPIDVGLLLFMLSAIISIFINSAPVVLSVIGMRPLLRYIAIFYLLSNIDMPSNKVKNLLIALLFIGVLQSLLTSVQHFSGISKIFYPRATDLEIEGQSSQFRLAATGYSSGREQGAGIGTFGDSVLLALYLFFITILTWGFYLKMEIKNLLLKFMLISITFLSLIALFFTYSRASVLIALMAIPLMLFLDNKIKKLFFMGIMAAFLFAILMFDLSITGSTDTSYYNPKKKYTDPISNITDVFSQNYVQHNLEHSRGWILTEIGIPIVKSFNLFGYGPSGEESLDRMVKEDVTGTMPFNNLSIINDVYWVAMLSYYGFVGLVIFIFILWKIFKTSMSVYKNSDDKVFRMLGLCMAAIIILSIPYTFIVRTFAFRPFGFYLWLLAGIVAAEYRRIKMNEQRISSTPMVV